MSDYGGEGFEAFIEREIPRLLVLAALLGAQKETAWDLVQETLVRVGLRWTNLDPSSDVHAYASKVLRNLHISKWRKLRRELPFIGRPYGNVDVSGLEAIEARTELMQALQTLPDGQRAVVVLRYFEDRTERETAAILECSVGTVKSQHAKAIAKLRKFLMPVAETALVAQPAKEER
jgi:RNA polymerase sigma-70 factor (sigma-E family)